MHKSRIISALALAATLAITTASMATAQDGTKQKPGRVNNNPTADTSGDNLLRTRNARITRSKDGIQISMKLTTPEAGGYRYPETVPAERQAQPEVFTGWVFIFNNPENCTSFPGTEFPCGAQDFNDEVKAGAYNFSGTTNALRQTSKGEIVVNPDTDGMVVLEGAVGVGQEQNPPVVDGTTTHPLENPMGAEIHVAIAPHGQLDVATLPDELYRPAGNPACDCWWVATFEGAL